MSIFDNMSKKIKVSSELELMVKLKYGSPYPNIDEFLNAIPLVVLNGAYQQLSPFPSKAYDEIKRIYIRIHLLQLANRDNAANVLMNKLYEYHTLLPI